MSQTRRVPTSRSPPYITGQTSASASNLSSNLRFPLPSLGKVGTPRSGHPRSSDCYTPRQKSPILPCRRPPIPITEKLGARNLSNQETCSSPSFEALRAVISFLPSTRALPRTPSTPSSHPSDNLALEGDGQTRGLVKGKTTLIRTSLTSVPPLLRA
ncbi:hypothetical protein BDP81DRAFT_207669 [Colletotrichum phormii]|uniref:Uncharacterized protein n=1 Tax=Colletotrichum phormii TaxID=359342 RepID=A0AAI9ZV51_9PEZI|nr:uncharacterized protein BDP81DRAFT_207669 [Colletotrichum phormii]KAK1638415.1 hypothetical protein BDP81DRAFT_207669 [Colletotrichum phormii]